MKSEEKKSEIINSETTKKNKKGNKSLIIILSILLALILIIGGVFIIGNQNKKVEAEKEPEVEYSPNEGIGSGKGYTGKIQLGVLVENGKFSEVRIIENGELEDKGKAAVELLTDRINKGKYLDIEGVSGATVTSTAFMEALIEGFGISYGKDQNIKHNGQEIYGVWKRKANESSLGGDILIFKKDKTGKYLSIGPDNKIYQTNWQYGYFEDKGLIYYLDMSENLSDDNTFSREADDTLKWIDNDNFVLMQSLVGVEELAVEKREFTRINK